MAVSITPYPVLPARKKFFVRLLARTMLRNESNGVAGGLRDYMFREVYDREHPIRRQMGLVGANWEFVNELMSDTYFSAAFAWNELAADHATVDLSSLARVLAARYAEPESHWVYPRGNTRLEAMIDTELVRPWNKRLAGLVTTSVDAVALYVHPDEDVLIMGYSRFSTEDPHPLTTALRDPAYPLPRWSVPAGHGATWLVAAVPRPFAQHAEQYALLRRKGPDGWSSAPIGKVTARADLPAQWSRLSHVGTGLALLYGSTKDNDRRLATQLAGFAAQALREPLNFAP